jgi:predicted alpha/beta superfamily hydrolase
MAIETPPVEGMMASILQPGIEIRDLRSDILGRDLRLYVKLPWRYVQTDASYSVLYCTDANRSFPLYSTTSLVYETPGATETEIVIVGVGYRVDDDRLRGLAQWAAWRTQDLTPVRSAEVEAYWRGLIGVLLGNGLPEVRTGGAAVFLRSLREEVIPFVESTFRVSPDRGFAGYSYGGLFTLYALFHDPSLFARYFAGSPSISDQVFQDEAKYASSHGDLEARLFLTVGSRETELVDQVQRLADRLRSRSYPGLEVVTHVFEGEGHRSAMAAAVSRALAVLYDERWLD